VAEAGTAKETGANGVRGIVDSAATASATAVATAAAIEVSKAVRMRGVEAPDVDGERTFIAIRDLDESEAGGDERRKAVDEVGLPLVYNKDLIQKYWDKEQGALQARWAQFLGQAVPFLTKVAALGIRGGAAKIQENDAELARDARIIMQELGPTYIKLGQVLSVRPDVLPPAALEELAILQDSVKPFDTRVAIDTIERELGRPLGAVFSSISEEPVAAASLAQVYRAVRADTGETVAVKVQRPGCLETVSKDLYVLRRAAEVYQGLIERFAPQQRTDYVSLLNQWAVGFYTELDFSNEGRNQTRLKELLVEEGVTGVYVPRVHQELSTRRILVTEWVDGVKLSECEPEEIRKLISIGQEAFLTQLLQVGFFHGDPHPGNLMKMDDASKGTIALLDFGLVASVSEPEMNTMINSIIHLANRDFDALVDDFIELEILPTDCDRAVVVPLMDKALTPYIKGGGAKKYEAEIRKTYGMDGTAGFSGNVGGFQAMTQDMLTVLNQVPFSIPPSFALLGRAVVTLEGLALMGDPDYQLVMESYPWIARKIVRDGDNPESERALNSILYGGGESLRGQRLSGILNSAMGAIAQDSGRAAFLDLDADNLDVGLGESVSYVLSDDASSLRGILEDEMEKLLSLTVQSQLRQTLRSALTRALPQPPALLRGLLPAPAELPLPLLVPRLPEGVEDAEILGAIDSPVAALSAFPVTPVFEPASAVVEAVAPPLQREEEIYLIAMRKGLEDILGADMDSVLAPSNVLSVLSRVLGVELPSVGPKPAASAPSALDERVSEVWGVVGGLTEEERERLRASTNRVVSRAALGVIKRMQALIAL